MRRTKGESTPGGVGKFPFFRIQISRFAGRFPFLACVFIVRQGRDMFGNIESINGGRAPGRGLWLREGIFCRVFGHSLAVSCSSGGSRGLQAPGYSGSKEGLQARVLFLAAGSVLQMKRHGVQRSTRCRTEGMSLRRRYQSPANRVPFDIRDTLNELLLRHDLALVEAARPHIQLTFQTEGEASLYELRAFSSETSGAGVIRA
jgi:hypothetical protein